MKRTRFFVLMTVLAILLTACGSAGSVSENYDSAEEVYLFTDAETPAGQLESLSSSTASLDVSLQTDRKLIKTVTLEAETEHYDDLMTGLESQIASLGGYIESRESRGQRSRFCSMTIRIPAESLGQFVAHVNENANVTSSSESTEDITLQYVDTEAKITALETEQARLLELLENAQNLTEILEIEERLSEVTYELERYSSQKRSYDNLVTYSTVHLGISEVQVLTPTEEPTVWQRISSGFAESLNDVGTGLVDIFVWIIACSPHLVIWGGILTGVVLLVRRLGKKRRRPAKPVETPRENA